MTADTDTATGWVVVGSTADLTPGEGRTYVVDGRQVAVFLLADGTVRATGAVCPHRGGPVADGQIDLGTVTCPLHQYRFRFADGTCTDDGIGALEVFAARVDGSRIALRVPAVS
jgi:nitrite reductase (NADH) small subunit